MLGAGLGLLLAMAFRWLKHGGNRSLLPARLMAGRLRSPLVTRQRALLAADLLRAEKKFSLHEAEMVHHAMWNAMLLEAVSEGQIDHNKVRFVSVFFSQLSGHRLVPEAAAEAAETVLESPHNALTEIGRARDTSWESREYILAGAILTSLADGVVVKSEANRLGDIADALGMERGDRQIIYTELASRLGETQSLPASALPPAK